MSDEKNIILCHKCGGLLACAPKENKDLLDCSCISGWVRGFEPVLNRAEAIAAQIKASEDLLALYERQGRGPQYTDRAKEEVAKMKKLQNDEVTN